MGKAAVAWLMVAFWMWMVFDCFFLHPPERRAWLFVVLLTPLGAAAYFSGCYLPQVVGPWLRRVGRVRLVRELAGEADWQELGELYRDRHHWKQALQCYEQIIARSPGRVSVYLDMAECLIRLRNHLGAIAMLRNLIRLDPCYDELAAPLLSQSLAAIGDWHGALTALEAVSPERSCIETRYRYAVCLWRCGRTQEAIGLLDELLTHQTQAGEREAQWIRAARRLRRRCRVPTSREHDDG